MFDGGDRARSYFETRKKGEFYEFKKQLNSSNVLNVKEAVKSIIQKITAGEDLSELFSDVIKHLSTKNLELKKLVYLYIIKCAHLQPEKTILVVNIFQKDAREHPNALVRALAIRTMGYIRVKKILEYLFNPLSSALSDSDPYVRKTAVICVAKLFALDKDMVLQRGFLDRLFIQLTDSNPMVVSNTVASIRKISLTDPKILSKTTNLNTKRLIIALGECTEWGQAFILNLISDVSEMISDPVYVIERVLPRLSHRNGAVVMAALKTIVLLMGRVKKREETDSLTKKIKPSIVTLISTNSEIQYIVLKNLGPLLYVFPNLFVKDVKVLFCKYNDPPYIKVEKINLLVEVSNIKNIDLILLELDDYSRDVDVDLSRLGISAIAKVAEKLDFAAVVCIKRLIKLMQMKRDHIASGIVIAFKDIFFANLVAYRPVRGRLVPTGIVKWTLNVADSIERREALEAVVWLLGEFYENENAVIAHINKLLVDFKNLWINVKYQILTSAVKLFLKNPTTETKKLWNVVTEKCKDDDDVDLNQKSEFYHEIICANYIEAKNLVLFNEKTFPKHDSKPIISTKRDFNKSVCIKSRRDLSRLGSLSAVIGADFGVPDALRGVINIKRMEEIQNKRPDLVEKFTDPNKTRALTPEELRSSLGELREIYWKMTFAAHEEKLKEKASRSGDSNNQKMRALNIDYDKDAPVEVEVEEKDLLSFSAETETKKSAASPQKDQENKDLLNILDNEISSPMKHQKKQKKAKTEKRGKETAPDLLEEGLFSDFDAVSEKEKKCSGDQEKVKNDSNGVLELSSDRSALKEKTDDLSELFGTLNVEDKSMH